MDFTQPWDLGDVTFIVEEKKIYANKQILTLSSEVFKVMFSSSFKENDMAEIPLPDTKFEDFLELMKVLHPQTLTPVDDSNAICLLLLADCYHIKQVMSTCEKILCATPSVKNLVRAQTYKLDALHNHCVQYLKDTPLRSLQLEDGYNEVEPTTLVEVLTHKFDALKEDVGKITRWGGVDEDCEAEKCFYRRNAQGWHCSGCKAIRFEKIKELIEKN